MKVAICTPSLDGKVQDEFNLSFAKTLIACSDEGINLFPVGCRGITVVHDARNHCVAMALNAGADKVFFIDSDMSWRAQDFVRLVKSGQPLIGGVYQQRTRYWMAPLQLAAKFETVPPVLTEDGYVRMLGYGTGFMCIDRSVFDHMIREGMAPLYVPKIEGLKKGSAYNKAYLHYRSHFAFSWLMQPVEDIHAEYREILDEMDYPYEIGEDGGRYVRLQCGEDFTFLNKARDLGYRIICDPDCELVHYDGTVAHATAYRDIQWGLNGEVSVRPRKEAV